jgi:hypothetical protein
MAEDTQDAKADAKAAKARAKAQRPWYKKKRWIALLAIVALAVIGMATSGGDGDDTQTATDSQEQGSAEAGGSDADQSADAGSGGDEDEMFAAGEPAVDGQFTFTVAEGALECGQQTVGSGAMAEDAQGQWCVLTATVENTGDEARGLSAFEQLLIDEQDRQHEASVPMAVADESPFYAQINPGNSVEGRFFFDVPTDLEPSHVELHDSAFSGGVQVDLSG